MRKRFLSILGIVLIATSSGCFKEETGNMDFYNKIKKYGAQKNDIARKIQQTIDGGFIIVGETDFGKDIETGADVYLIKTDLNGNVKWSKKYGGKKWDVCVNVKQTPDGYILVGATKSFGEGDKDVYIIKTDLEGEKLWEKTFGGNKLDSGSGIDQTLDGGYIFTCGTYSFGEGEMDIYLIKTDSKGNKMWEKTFGGKKDDSGYYVKEIADGGFIIGGPTRSYNSDGQEEIFLMKTDSTGNQIWIKTYGCSGNKYFQNARQLSDGNFIITGYIESSNTKGKDIYLLKVDSNGNEIWSESFVGNKDEMGFDVCQTSDRGFIIVGGTIDESNPSLIKTDINGKELWRKTFRAEYARGYSILQTIEGDYIVVGYEGSFYKEKADAFFMKINSNGNVIENK